MLTTRLSLIDRLHDAGDHEAWCDFAQTYLPVIVNSLRAKGLQHADAEDAAQQVLIAVSRSLAQRPHDPDRARFRTWLETVTKNAALTAMARFPKFVATGDSAVHRQLEQHPDSDGDLWDLEYQKQEFRLAAEQVSQEFAPETWQAFWLTAVDGEPIEQVAKKLNKEVGSIYAARSRVMRRLREVR